MKEKNNRLYVAVGCYDTALCGDFEHGAVWRYNPGTDRWALESRVPNGETFHAGGGIVGGKLYVADDYGAVEVLTSRCLAVRMRLGRGAEPPVE